MAAEPMDDEYDASRKHSAFIPLVLLTATYLAWAVFQTVQLSREREALHALHANQDKLVQQSKKVRENLDKIARETQLLAARGNKNAKLVVDELRKRGITINPAAPVAPSRP